MPPVDIQGLEPLFSAQFAELGLRIKRAALQDGETRQSSPTGRHLSIYVEPKEAWNSSRYLESFTPSAKILAPFVFEKWSGLDSFDICQEPFSESDSVLYPPPETAVEMTRRAGHVLDGSTNDPLPLLLAAFRDPGAIKVATSKQVGEEPAYLAAIEEVKNKLTPGTVPDP